MQTYQNLQTKLKDETWKNRVSDDDVKLLEDVEVMSANLISQVYVFIDLFHQYIDLVQSAAIFSPEFVEPEGNDANVYPTQTIAPAPANRSERRAEAKRQSNPKPKMRKTPFEVVNK